MKYLSILIYAVIAHLTCTAQIAAGDIAFVGFNADNPDQFTIITTNYLEDGTQIYFTDAGWTGTALYASEGSILWTVPTGGLPTNTMVTFTGAGAGGFTTFPTGTLETGVSVSSGTLVASGIAASMALTTNGDQILAFTGSIASPVFIACANFNGSWSWTGTNNSEQTLTPPGLTSGTDCVVLSDRDNGKIDCLLLPDPATVSDYNNASNWVYNDATRYTLPPTLGTCEFLLPLDLIAFDGAISENGNQLNWTTANEIDIKEFIIERSANGESFIAVGAVDAIGDALSANSYEFIDDMPAGGEMYYRLKITNLDNTYTYSKIILIEDELTNTIKLFPNPVTDYATLIFSNNCNNCNIQIYSANGKVIKNLAVSVNGQQHLEINTQNLQPGFYVISIVGDAVNLAIPFIK